MTRQVGLDYNVHRCAMNETLVAFVKEVMRRRHRLPSQLAADLGVSHTSVNRWLSGKDRPNFESCVKLATYAVVPLDRVLSIVGYLQPLPDTGPSEWPEFREYAREKYSNELDDDLITMIEDLIERRRSKRERNPSVRKDIIDHPC